MTEQSTRAASLRLIKAAFAAIALMSVLAGLALYVLRAQFGIGEDTARMLAIVFIVVGVADTLVLFLWDRIFRQSS